MSSIVEKGPENITIDGRKVPAWFIDDQGHRFEFEGEAQLDADGDFELSKLRDDQCILAPGVLYQKATYRSNK